jgi:hypothetical protein
MLVVPSVTTVAHPGTPREILTARGTGVVKRHNNHGRLDTFERCLVGRRCINEPLARLAAFTSQGETDLERTRTFVQVSLFSLVRAPNAAPLCVSAWWMTSATALSSSESLSIVFHESQNKAVHLQGCLARLGAIMACQLDLKESVVTDEDDVVMCCRIEFAGSVRRDDGITTGMESGREELTSVTSRRHAYICTHSHL